MAEQNQAKRLAPTLIFKTRGNNKTIRYVLSNEDYLTLLRAVEFEGEPRDGVAWTLLQRFAYVYPIYHSLSNFVEAYAQPINPQWFPNGKKHLEWVKKLSSTGKTAEALDEQRRAKLRIYYAATPINNISQKTKDVLETVFAISNSPVPGSVHYRAPTISTKDTDEAKKARTEFASKHQLPRIIDYGNILNNNWFFGESKSASFSIRALLTEVSNIGNIALILLFTSGISGLIYQLWKNVKHA